MLVQSEYHKRRGLFDMDIRQVLIFDVVQSWLKVFLAEFFFHYHYNPKPNQKAEDLMFIVSLNQADLFLLRVDGNIRPQVVPQA